MALPLGDFGEDEVLLDEDELLEVELEDVLEVLLGVDVPGVLVSAAMAGAAMRAPVSATAAVILRVLVMVTGCHIHPARPGTRSAGRARAEERVRVRAAWLRAPVPGGDPRGSTPFGRSDAG